MTKSKADVERAALLFDLFSTCAVRAGMLATSVTVQRHAAQRLSTLKSLRLPHIQQMDATSIAVAAAVGSELSPTANELLKAILLPAAKNIGDYLGELTQFRRKNLNKMLNRSADMVDQAGGPIRLVSPRLAVPLLTKASLEDDLDLSERWAALLANASTATCEEDVQPIFADILAQLTPFNARVFDAVVCLDGAGGGADAIANVEQSGLSPWGGSPNDIVRHLGHNDSVATVEVALGVLASAGLVEREPAIRTEPSGVPVFKDQDLVLGHSVAFKPSVLGQAFAKVCKAPPAREGAA